jgi:hypothetical protein
MKFAEHLSAHITPEWRKQYINYEVNNVNNNLMRTVITKTFLPSLPLFILRATFIHLRPL